jgi:hypothetical protein
MAVLSRAQLARNALARTCLLKGSDSPEANAARRNLATAKLLDRLQVVTDAWPELTKDQQAELIDALYPVLRTVGLRRAAA